MCDSSHVHTEHCEPAPEATSLLEQLEGNKQPLTESQFRQLRGKYFTVRHHRVKECNHLLDQINEPTFRNCEFCWFTFFSSHGELVQVTDEAFKTHGAAFVDRLRGVTYRKMFTRFMSTMARFKAEADALQEKTDEQSRDVQESGSTGQGDGQGEGDTHISTAGEQGQQTDTVNSDQPSLA